jgi:restriction system protein
MAEHRHLRPSGGYRNLHSFRAATIIYDATASFCNRFVDSRSRMRDQMVQAARSGRQNIAEGSRASATSSQTELRLVNVARASLDELLLDYEDYLRQNGHAQWAKDSPEAKAVRSVGKDQTDRSDPSEGEPPQPTPPVCPRCGGTMAVRTARKGPRTGSQFWGCVKYPDCKGTRAL